MQETANIQIQPGDIFKSQAEVLVCTANTVGAMGAGIALQFRNRHPDLYYYYKKECRRKRFTHRTLMVVYPDGAPYRVLMLPTKRFWGNPSRLDDVDAGIKAMSRWCRKNDIKTIAMTPPGCGLGGLDFETEVRPLLYEYFKGLSTVVQVYLGTR